MFISKIQCDEFQWRIRYKAIVWGFFCLVLLLLADSVFETTTKMTLFDGPWSNFVYICFSLTYVNIFINVKHAEIYKRRFMPFMYFACGILMVASSFFGFISPIEVTMPFLISRDVAALICGICWLACGIVYVYCLRRNKKLAQIEDVCAEGDCKDGR